MLGCHRWSTPPNLDAVPQEDLRITRITLTNGERWSVVGVVEQALIDSIENPEMRGQVNMQRIMGMLRTDPERAERLLDELDLTEEQRRQAEAWIARMRGRL